MSYRLDEIDRRIVYALMRDARNTSAPAVADQVNVSPGTVRNRIDQLEDHGVIQSYTTAIDFERADDHLTNLYVCTVPVSERKSLAREASSVPGVINVRELMTGRGNLHVLAVGENTADLRRVARMLSGLGIEVEDETLVEGETHTPYAAFGPEGEVPASEPTDVVSLTGDATVADLTVQPGAPVVDHTLEEAVQRGLLDEESLVIAIERGEEVVTPRGTTTIRTDDIVTVLCRGGDTDRVSDAFVGDDLSSEL